MSSCQLRPGVRLGRYPQRRDDDYSAIERSALALSQRLARPFTGVSRSPERVASRILKIQRSLVSLSDLEFDEVIQELREDLTRRGLKRRQILRAFAVVREASQRVLGKSHYDVQLFGGWLMINGMLAEMETGEGKTLTTSLAACTAALANIPVHVVTANDYLAERDRELLRPLYDRLGLSSESVIDGMADHTRKRNYRADIVHTTNKVLAFDYLRDRINMDHGGGVLSHLNRHFSSLRDNGGETFFLRGLCFALVDEADSVLIDEARTPLIISRTIPNAEHNGTYGDAVYLASVLIANQDYRQDSFSRSIELTDGGRRKLVDLVAHLGSVWQDGRKREVLVTQALHAKENFQRDRDYLVESGRVRIIDQSTGRVMEDRHWEDGLQQMIEAKEGCLITERREPVARTTYQRFYNRYLRVGGASGTLDEVASELRRSYGLEVVRVPTHRPVQRDWLGYAIHRDNEALHKSAMERIKAVRSKNRPLLIGVSSVAESEIVSGWLTDESIPHEVLNAKQDRREAEIVANAGQLGAVTVATNMAGRGTDIPLGPGVTEAGGLHVLSLGGNEMARIDRQLYGRSARQGDPGSAETVTSLEAELISTSYTSASRRLLAGITPRTRALPRWLGRRVVRIAQKRNEVSARRNRARLMKEDRRLERALAIAGSFE